MLDRTDFVKKQLVFFIPSEGDKLSFRNDNLVIKDKDGKVKSQISGYRIFMVFVVGDTSITTGLLKTANKFGFSLCLMNRSMKMYRFISARMEGNTVLRRKQYQYQGVGIAQYIITNKIQNQAAALKNIRNKNQGMKDAIKTLEEYIYRLENEEFERDSLLGIEGSASRVYFPQIFNNIKWKSRKPRIKPDCVNACLDIGYTILFNVMDGLVNAFGFDEYCGVLHTFYYMRKSLVCDLMEPFRPMIDYATRKAFNLGQIKEEDFQQFNGKWVLDWKYSSAYTKIYLGEILNYREELFLFVRDYYRAFMKDKDISEYPVAEY